MTKKQKLKSSSPKPKNPLYSYKSEAKKFKVYPSAYAQLVKTYKKRCTTNG